jgi:uncharacterized protein (TIGR00156 family)
LVQADGFKGPDNLPLVTTATLAEQADDSLVKLEGRIVTASGEERYEFSDEAGSIVVEIDDELWRGVDVTPDDRVRLWIEVDKDLLDTEYEAERVEKLAP